MTGIDVWPSAIAHAVEATTNWRASLSTHNPESPPSVDGAQQPNLADDPHEWLMGMLSPTTNIHLFRNLFSLPDQQPAADVRAAAEQGLPQVDLATSTMHLGNAFNLAPEERYDRIYVAAECDESLWTFFAQRLGE